MPGLRRRLVLAYAGRLGRFASLQKLGAIHGTDKSSHTANGRTNCSIYDEYLRGRRRERFTLLELGVYRGDSLRMWRDYFPKATVIGLDVDPEAVRRAPEFEIYVGSQADPELLDRILAEHPDLAVVLDDASHLNPLTFAAFDHLFPRLPSGGLYIVEDLAPGGYGADWPQAVRHDDGTWGRSWPGMDRNEGLSLLDNRRADLEAFRNRLAYDCDLAPWDETVPGQVAFVHHWPSILVVGRR